MKKYLSLTIILCSNLIIPELNAAKVTYGTSTVTIGTKQPTKLYSIPYVNSYNEQNTLIPNPCTFYNISAKLRQGETPKQQREHLKELISSNACSIKNIGGPYKFGETVEVNDNLVILIENKHGAIACKSARNFAVRTGGKSHAKKMLTGGLLTGGSEIFCDEGIGSATVADKSQLNNKEKNRLQILEYSNHNR